MLEFTGMRVILILTFFALVAMSEAKHGKIFFLIKALTKSRIISFMESYVGVAIFFK